MYIVIGILVVLAVVVLVMVFPGGKQPDEPAETGEPFSMPIDSVFTIEMNNNVVVTGAVAAGRVVPGDALCVYTEEDIIPVTVIALEAFRRDCTSAKTGDSIGIMISGIEETQVSLPATIASADKKT